MYIASAFKQFPHNPCQKEKEVKSGFGINKVEEEKQAKSYIFSWFLPWHSFTWKFCGFSVCLLPSRLLFKYFDLAYRLT